MALVSDAGTPLVSDPGERLLTAVVEAGHPVTAVPGPSAVLAALTLAGLGTERFSFLGFLPRKAGARRALLERVATAEETLVLFESPQRLAATLAELADTAREASRVRLPGSSRSCTREVARGSLDELAERFADGARGEVTLVVAGAQPAPAPAVDDLDDEIRARLASGETPRDVAARLASAGLVAPRRVRAGERAAREVARASVGQQRDEPGLVDHLHLELLGLAELAARIVAGHHVVGLLRNRRGDLPPGRLNAPLWPQLRVRWRTGFRSARRSCRRVRLCL